ncbi:hypothetical protein JOE31_002748 [Arthrobacter sp. PvP023]|uniref:hypothetical protein n=1 Tax=Micrococcaceae TaxID=1268 RepID=UPI001AEAE7EC|nr:hypothetical protein [Arthrobacter sp. PvP023]MBP1136516.1 hypothetical protein [Arthrobacter sp. PvP023]
MTVFDIHEVSADRESVAIADGLWQTTFTLPEASGNRTYKVVGKRSGGGTVSSAGLLVEVPGN